MSELTAPVARPGISELIGAWPQSRFWLVCVDLYPALAAASLPWSTTAVSIFMVLWLIVVVPTIHWQAFCASLRAPASFLPLALLGLALAGLFWTADSWPVGDEAAGRAAAALSLRTLRARAMGVVRVPGFLCPVDGIVMADVLCRLEGLAGGDGRRPCQELHRPKP